MPIKEDVKNIIDEYIVDISPCTHSNEDLVSLPLSYCINDESFKDDRFEDIFTIEYDFHALTKCGFLMMIMISIRIIGGLLEIPYRILLMREM